MKNVMKAVAAMMLMTVVVCVVGCKKDDNSDDGGNNNGSGGGGILNGHEWVDLGLPSGTLWAACNVGATTPEGFGDYFAWGETTQKTTYDWNTYKYCMGNYNTLTKYCSDSSYGYNGFTDTLTMLQVMDDAATVNWGNDWRTPTYDEWIELFENTTNTWTTQNGVIGCLFIADNGRNIFLPASGYRYDDELKYAGNEGYYWSNSNSFYGVDGQHAGVYAWAYILYYNDNICDPNSHYRYCGLSVRPVVNHTSNGSEEEYIVNVSASPANGGTVSGDGTYEIGQLCTLKAIANQNYTFDHWNDGSTNNPRTISVMANASYVAYFAYNGGDNGSAYGHEYVDLGLPSGTLWATCNVGATTPEGCGDYFAWGETSTKFTYNWRTYRYCNSSGSTLTKYCNNPNYGNNGFTDDLTTLQSSDDAAATNWAGDWRIPTKTDWEELKNNTTVTWITQNGVKGCKFTSSNGNSIFMPAAGRRSDGSLNYADSYGYYWSSSLDTSLPYYAWYLYFYSGGSKVGSGYNRSYGRSIRAVCSLAIN